MILAARFHGFYEYLHPFRDGNGRTGRLLSNFILLQSGLPELIIRKEDRQQYIGALKQIRTENTDELLISFFFEKAIQQMEDDLGQKRKASRMMLFGLTPLTKPHPLTPLQGERGVKCWINNSNTGSCGCKHMPTGVTRRPAVAALTPQDILNTANPLPASSLFGSHRDTEIKRCTRDSEHREGFAFTENIEASEMCSLHELFKAKPTL